MVTLTEHVCIAMLMPNTLPCYEAHPSVGTPVQSGNHQTSSPASLPQHHYVCSNNATVQQLRFLIVHMLCLSHVVVPMVTNYLTDQQAYLPTGKWSRLGQDDQYKSSAYQYVSAKFHKPRNEHSIRPKS